jgi:DNA mismatch repair protein MutL
MSITNSKIKLLPESLINKIAAGEVIERPSSVIKELVENSIDAGSKNIIIKIKNGGKEYIEISDDGDGIDDVELAIMRHSTSKINSEEDLFNIHSLGFRGEALASITEISKTSIITKTKDNNVATKIEINGGKIISTGNHPREKGTTIIVENIFFNTPVRKKYLKGDEVEKRKCLEIITRLALSKPEVNIKLISEDKEIFNFVGQNNFENKLLNVFGTEITKSLIPINHKSEDFQISGFIAKPYVARNDKDKQFVIINNRFVKCKVVEDAIYDAYHTMLFLEKHPVFIIYININPKKIDVNVHPTKIEVRIENEDELHKEILLACKDSFVKNSLIPDIEVNIDENKTNLNFIRKEIKKELHEIKETYKQETLSPIIKEKETKNDERKTKLNEEFEEKEENHIHYDEKIKEINVGNEIIPNKVKYDFGIKKILGQINKLYILCETSNGLLIIDQHAAEEKVLFEKFIEDYKNKKINTQELLNSQIIQVTPKEMELFFKYEQKLNQLGFVVEMFSDNEIRVRAIPEMFGKIKSDFFIDTLHELNNLENGIELKLVEERIAYSACRAAIKAGDELTIKQMEDLISKLEQIEKPFSCPHGRPTLIHIDYKELEKKFKRIA